MIGTVYIHIWIGDCVSYFSYVCPISRTVLQELFVQETMLIQLNINYLQLIRNDEAKLNTSSLFLLKNMNWWTYTIGKEERLVENHMHSALGLFDLTPLNPNLIRQHNRQVDGVDDPMCRYQVVKQVHLICLFCRDMVLFTLKVAGTRTEKKIERSGTTMGTHWIFFAMLLDVQKWMFPLLVSISPWKGSNYSNGFFFFYLHPWELGALRLRCPTRLCVWQSAEPLMVPQCNASWTYSGMYVNCYLLY